MFDHVESGPIYPVDLGNMSIYTDPTLIAATLEEYHANGTRPMTGFGFDLIGWTKLPGSYCPALGEEALADLAKFPDDWPEIEYVIAETPRNIPGNFAFDLYGHGRAYESRKCHE
jgi:choline dehydrogenase